MKALCPCFPVKLKGAIGAALFLICLASCGKSQAEKDVDVLTSTTPNIQNIDKLLGEIEGLLKSYCNEAESLTFLCGDSDDPKYYTISPNLVARLSDLRQKIISLVYSEAAKECRARDGSGVMINYPYGATPCLETFSTYNISDFAAEMSKKFPGKNPLIAPGVYDFAVASKNQEAANQKEAAESQKRLEDWAVRSYEAGQRHQEKCQDQLESRGYGDPGCY